jgi:hypothetical protein
MEMVGCMLTKMIFRMVQAAIAVIFGLGSVLSVEWGVVRWKEMGCKTCLACLLSDGW